MKLYELIRTNAYGKRWHLLDVEKHQVVFSGRTKRQCADYCRRHDAEFIGPLAHRKAA